MKSTYDRKYYTKYRIHKINDSGRNKSHVLMENQKPSGEHNFFLHFFVVLLFDVKYGIMLVYDVLHELIKN